MVKKGSPEALAFSSVRNCGLEGGLHDGARHCRDIDTRGGNASQGPLEGLTRWSKEIALGHSYALKANAASGSTPPEAIVLVIGLGPSKSKITVRSLEPALTVTRSG